MFSIRLHTLGWSITSPEIGYLDGSFNGLIVYLPHLAYYASHWVWTILYRAYTGNIVIWLYLYWLYLISDFCFTKPRERVRVWKDSCKKIVCIWIIKVLYLRNDDVLPDSSLSSLRRCLMPPSSGWKFETWVCVLSLAWEIKFYTHIK